MLLAQRRRAARQGQVEVREFVPQVPPEVQHGHPVARGRDQLGLRREHLLVGVLVAAVRGEAEQVQRPVRQLRQHALARPVVAERLRHTRHPELFGVRHMRGKVDEVRVVPDVVAHHLAHGVQRLPGSAQDRGLGQPRQVLQELRRQLEPHKGQRRVQPAGGAASFAGGPLGQGKPVGVPDDQRCETVRHPWMIAEVCESAHRGFCAPIRRPWPRPPCRATRPASRPPCAPRRRPPAAA